MWILSYTTIFGPTFISVIYDIIGENLFMNSLLVSTIRSIWAISIAWIIFMCQTGEFKLMNKLLSSRYWMPIGKLGFTLYLVHPVLQYNFTASQDQNTNFELPRMVSQNPLYACRNKKIILFFSLFFSSTVS